MRRKWLVSFSIVGGLALLLIGGRGITGRAVGGDAEDTGGGCGGGDLEPGTEATAEELAQQKSALCYDCEGGGGTEVQCNWNGIKDNYETDRDCGKIAMSGCPKCTAGKRCSSSSDCTTGLCSGGYCQRRQEGEYCSQDGDCVSNLCASYTVNGSPTGRCVKACTSDADCGGTYFNCTQQRNVDRVNYMRPTCSPFYGALDQETTTRYAASGLGEDRDDDAGSETAMVSPRACSAQGAPPRAARRHQHGKRDRVASRRHAHRHPVHPAIAANDPSTSPSDRCYYAYGTRWCADWYSGKWCTNYYPYTYCTMAYYGTRKVYSHTHCN